ncbi:MAG: DUF1801 domain-containing protein [Cypionkella sp.]
MDNLATLLAPLPLPIGNMTRRLVTLLAAHPGLEGKVMTGWKSVNFRHRNCGHICAVFPNAERVALYFERGRLLSNDEGLLQGDDLKRGRYLTLGPEAEIPLDSIGILVSEAIALVT